MGSSNCSSSSKKQEDWHCAAFLHAGGTNEDERERSACPGWAGGARGTRLALTCPPGGPRAVPTDWKKTFRAERTGPKRSDVWGRGLGRRRRWRWVGVYNDLDWDVDWGWIACMRTWIRKSMAMDMGVWGPGLGRGWWWIGCGDGGEAIHVSLFDYRHVVCAQTRVTQRNLLSVTPLKCSNSECPRSG